MKITDTERKIRVTFPNYTGDVSRMMTIQELKENYANYLIIDPNVGEVDLEKLANLEEVVAMPPIAGG